MAAKVSPQLLSQKVTNYSPFPSGEEHPILQILTRSTPGKPREVWPLRGLQDGSKDLAKGPISFALASRCQPLPRFYKQKSQACPTKKLFAMRAPLTGQVGKPFRQCRVPLAEVTSHSLLAALILDALEVTKKDGTLQVWLYIFREKD